MKTPVLEPGEPPEIGKYYMVPTGKVLNCSSQDTFYVPVIGEPHSDPQFGVNVIHYHVDGRFARAVTMPPYSHLIDNEGRTNGVFSTTPEGNNYYIASVSLMRYKCKRLTTGIIPASRDMNSHSATTKNYWTWYDSHLGKSCKGRKCPHLGTPMLDQGGVLICPLHNLHGNIITETIILPTT